MSTSYAVADTAQIRALTDNGVAYYTKLNERDQQSLVQLRQQRAIFEAEIATVDEVMRDLEDTIRRREARMRGDFISLLPAGEGSEPVGGDFPKTDDPEPHFSDPFGDVERAGGHS